MIATSIYYIAVALMGRYALRSSRFDTPMMRMATQVPQNWMMAMWRVPIYQLGKDRPVLSFSCGFAHRRRRVHLFNAAKMLWGHLLYGPDPFFRLNVWGYTFYNRRGPFFIVG